MTDVYADGDVWIAGGWHPEAGPAAWRSVDAVNWDRSTVENQQPDPTFVGPRLGPIVRLGDSLLSFGTFIGAGDGRGVYGWRSADGTSWEAIKSSSPLFATGYVVQATAVGEPALVAVENQFALYSGRIWAWTQATSWVETTPGADSDEPFGSGIQANDVVWSRDRFVVVGARSGSEDQFVAKGTSWISADGRTWTESDPNPALEGIQVSTVAGLPDGGFAALGQPESPGTASAGTVALTSPDGLRWTVATEPFPGAVSPVLGLVEVPDGVVAFGARSLWATSDGIHWTDAGALADSITAAAVMGNDIVVFMTDFENGTTESQRGVIGH